MGSRDLWTAALCALKEEDRELVAFDGQNELDVLSDLGQLVATARDTSIKKRWRFRRPGSGQTVVLRDLFSKIVVWIDRFKEIGDIVVQYDPVHAALPWAGIRFLLQLAVSDINRFAFVVEGAETIARSLSRYTTFEQIYLVHGKSTTRAVKGLEKALVKLYAVILVYLVRAKYYFEEHTPKRMAKSMITSQSDFETLLRNIDNELANVDRHAGLVDAERTSDISSKFESLSIDQRQMHARLEELLQSIDSPICRMSRQLEDLDDQLKRSERVEILRWLSPQPYMKHHQQIKKQALSGSGQWLLRDPLYIQWYKQSVSSLLWLHGKPGSGKSTLVSLVIEDMIARFEAGQSGLPVYFYCTRSAAEPDRSNPHAVLASILRQLSCVQPDAPLLSPVVQKYRSQGEGFSSNGLDLDDSRDLIIRLIEDYSMTTIIVDALDECDPLMRQSLLDAFEHILKESLGLVKIFVSSRNDQDIVSTLRDYPNMHISSDKNTADIEAYVETETMELVRTGQLLRNSRAKDKMATFIVEHISAGADGMFRWASLQLDVLRALKRDEDIRARLGKLPPKLEELYLEVYNNLISAQAEIGRPIIDNTLKLLLCAKEELYAADFLIAVVVNLDTCEGDVSVDSLLDLCNNFVLYDEDQDVFRFAHLSVREFLEKRPEFSEASCNGLAAECCLLQIIASTECPNTEHLFSDAHPLRLRQRPTYREYPSSANLLKYANVSWTKHCQSIPPSDRLSNSRFAQILRLFFSDNLESASPLDTWVQWFCNRVLIGTDSDARWKLQETLIGCAGFLSKSFFVAAYYGFSEIVTSCVTNRRLGDEEKDQGLLLAAMAAQHQIFDIISQSRKEWAMTEPLLLHAVRALDKGRLAWLLDKSSSTIITNRVFAAVAEDHDDGKMTILLKKYPDILVTEKMLQVAIESVSLTNFEMMMARAAKPAIKGNTFILRNSRPLSALSTKPITAYSEKILMLLDSMGKPSLTPHLIASAMYLSDEVVIKLMLERCDASNITERVVIRATNRGSNIFRLVLQNGGKITDAVLDMMAFNSDASVWHLLLDQGYELSVNVKRLKLVACGYKHRQEVMSLLLEHVDDTALVDEMTELIGAVASRGENEYIKLVLDHAKDVEVTQDMVVAAILSARGDAFERVKMFLDRSSGLQISEDMLIAAASDDDGFRMTQMLLERGGKDVISEYVLMAAACNRHQGYDIMQLLLELDVSVDITEDILISALQFSNPDFVMDLLERSEAKVFTGRLLEAAVSNPYYWDEQLRLLVTRKKITKLPEAVIIQAVGKIRGMDVILVLEEIFGHINLTEGLIAECFQRSTHKTIETLLSRVDPVHMTEEVWMCALKNDLINENGFNRVLAEKSLHIYITIEILVIAAQHVELNLFRFLWGRCRRSSVPEDLTNAAAKNWRDGDRLMEFLLDEADCVEVGEATLIAIMANRMIVHVCFDLLLERGLLADITDGMPETLLINGGIKVKCSSPKPLRISKGTKVTEEMFQIAAYAGDEGLLDKLSIFCELENIPQNWLDVARLYRGAEIGDVGLLKILLGRGANPNVACPDRGTPLVVAAHYAQDRAVGLLLSAGALPDGGPNPKRSPLCEAARWGRSSGIEIVWMLVNAGASLTFKDEEGRTPSMIAKSRGNILVFKYLEQCRKEQERKGRETSNSE